MVSFTIENLNTTRTKTKRCTQYHIQFILSFIGIKHPHAQQIMDLIAKDTLCLHTHPLPLSTFLTQLRTLLTRMHYTNPLSDLQVAWSLLTRQQSVCILLGGTSGCGKSTLASLLAHRIGITTVISTDHVRSLLRSFDPDKTTHLLWASSYYAGDCMDMQDTTVHPILDGYEAQNALLLDTLDKTIASYHQRQESLVIEGVSLSIESMRYLTKKHPNCIPMLVYISNQQKHAERFAIRAKYMTISPQSNKYIHYFDNIRLIQQHLCKAADTWKIPKINNTNMDKSLAVLHTTILNVLSRIQREGWTVSTQQGHFSMMLEEYSRVYEAAYSSKQVLRKIKQEKKPSQSQPSKHTLFLGHVLLEDELDHVDAAAWGSLAS
ncbi:hypothetical protein BDF14DRAFT_1996180 [Spinellus fusiger]|nr:hypothetical protein BDF14DRAFT_1996180 [Spinellus fusiger]